MSTILLKSNLQNESEVGDAMLLKKIASESSQGQMKAEQLENKLEQNKKSKKKETENITIKTTQKYVNLKKNIKISYA